MGDTLRIQHRSIDTGDDVKILAEYNQKCDGKLFNDLYLTLNEDPETGEGEKEIFIQVCKENNECNINGIKVSDKQRRAIIDFLSFL